MFPTLRTEVEYQNFPGYNIAITNRELSRGQLISEYLAYDGGRRLAQIRAARYRAEENAFGAAAALRQIVFDTRVAYFDLLRATQAEREFTASQERIAGFARAVAALRLSGRATANDALKMQLVATQAAIDLHHARSDRVRASIVLGSMIGQFGVDNLAVAPTHLAFPFDRGLDTNPAIEAARRERAATLADLNAAQAERSPTLKFTLTAGNLGKYPSHVFEPNNGPGASYGGQVTLPMFDGGAIGARIDQARASEHRATAQMRQTELDLRRQFAQAAIKYRESRETAETLLAARPPADDAFQLAWARFLGGGSITLFEVLDAYQQSQKVRTDRLDQEFAAEQAAATAAQILGS